MKLKDYEAKVFNILLNSPASRDNDMTLYAIYCNKYHKDISSKTLIEALTDTNLPSYESISRVRRKIQVKTPELRGKKYLERHKNEEHFIIYNRAD